MRKCAARKILLPVFETTELCFTPDEGSLEINRLPANFQQTYSVRKKSHSSQKYPPWAGTQFNLFPLVLDKNGVPWAEATIYLLSRIESNASPTMSSYASIADSLAAFLRFIEERDIDWMEFPSHKLQRPTYRYQAYLKLEIASESSRASTAKRRMSAVIAFYKWLIQEDVFSPENSPWQESDRYIQFKGTYGAPVIKKVKVHDVSIRAPSATDPYADTIDDGGKLRPLSKQEQIWLIEALIALGNTEMLLIHLTGLLTGARLQTILTFRVKHLRLKVSKSLSEVRIPIGPGTGIDTKNDKKLVLHLPTWFYEKLICYANSTRAINRRLRAEGADTEDQYLFLSVRGAPMYHSKSYSSTFDSSNKLRHAKSGQGVRQFVHEKVIPLVKTTSGESTFRYQFHDTRASYGMNLTDIQLQRVQSAEITLHQAREFVKSRMGHESAATTDRYLNYKENLQIASSVNFEYSTHLHQLIEIMQFN
jgi:integrase